jgi:hypothetical protein
MVSAMSTLSCASASITRDAPHRARETAPVFETAQNRRVKYPGGVKAYVLGAGASLNAGYPLASQLLQEPSQWLEQCDSSVHWVPGARNRIIQVRETFGSLHDFEGILGKLEEYGYQRVRPTGPTTYGRGFQDIVHDYTERMLGNRNKPTRGFYPQNLRGDLVSAFREYFYEIEERRSESTAYGVSLCTSPQTRPPPPVILSRDLKLLGYEDLVDPRVGPNGISVDNEGTFILPDPKKKFYWDVFWSPLWTAAASKLCQADEVFIHGYSMPDADTHTRKLLFENIRKSAVVNVYFRSKSDQIKKEFCTRGFTHVSSFPGTLFEEWAAAGAP